ncbi:conserved hypothetical protein [Lausannevirus]|uniref:Uncharacterized protein n=2 Tax=Lausannevirus TaxID=999883 RepID=A0A0N9PMI3_9VIRU|nr:hypothetical protein LAU_0414 [Lausannevirus]AEA07264.1 conserved hypothetical protein [Lausannevirus]ALH07071.1 hypothetical protein PMV_373 [Port-miou virus]
MFEFLEKGELVSLALEDENALRFAKRRVAKEKGAGERIREFWRKRRTNYKHRDENLPREEQLQSTKKFITCPSRTPKKYMLCHTTDTVNLLRIKGTNVRSCTISGDCGEKIMKFHLVPCNKEKVFIVELPESLPIINVVYRVLFVEFDADDISGVQQKGEYIARDARREFMRKEHRFRHECSTKVVVRNGSIYPSELFGIPEMSF